MSKCLICGGEDARITAVVEDNEALAYTLGLTVPICPGCAANSHRLACARRYTQIMTQRNYGWTADKFVATFGYDYICGEGGA